jgi:phage repressor protein C with HTH and peptisase S24 domain
MGETLGERVRRLREARGMSQEDLVKGMPEFSASALSQVESGRSKGMKPGNLVEIARRLDLTAEELVTGRVRKNGRRGREPDRVPVIGFAIATPEHDGYFDDMGLPAGGGDEFVAWPTTDPNAYALRVKGDSMQPRIRPGELVVVEPNARVAPGHDVLVRTKDGRRMVKQLLYQRGGEVALGSINQAHKQTTITLEEIESMHFVAGIVPQSSFRE